MKCHFSAFLIFVIQAHLLFSQNVGIGTTTPTGKLEVITNNSGKIQLTESTGTYPQVALKNANDTVRGQILLENSVDGEPALHFGFGGTQGPNRHFLFRANYTDILALRGETGFVGIGTTMPSESLEIANGGIQLNGLYGIGFGGERPIASPHVTDAARFYIDNEYFGTGTKDAFIIEKTDANHADPDGGIAFINTGSDSLQELAMAIRGNGRIGIGTPNPTSKIHIYQNDGYGDGEHKVLAIADQEPISGSGTAGLYMGYYADGATATGGYLRSLGQMPLFLGTHSTQQAITILNDGKVGINETTPTAELHVAGSICYTGTNTTCSDIRYKTDISELQNVLEKLASVNGVCYNWKTEQFPDKKFSEHRQIGVIAQDLEMTFPELVMTDERGFKTVDYPKLTAVLLQGMKEQQEMILEQNDTVAALSERVSQLEWLLETGLLPVEMQPAKVD